ncbi:unnamed protein product [Aphanomyces euteiches]
MKRQQGFGGATSSLGIRFLWAYAFSGPCLGLTASLEQNSRATRLRTSGPVLGKSDTPWLFVHQSYAVLDLHNEATTGLWWCHVFSGHTLSLGIRLLWAYGFSGPTPFLGLVWAYGFS